MDIDANNFKWELLHILKQLSIASFVTIDLEMSGISTKPQTGSRMSKPSLQEYYNDVKHAAEKYAIVQIGITIVTEDKERGFYLARPYNFFVSPLQANGLGADIKFERDICFNTSSCEFLLRNHFDIGKMFTHGVSYLGRNEEDICREQFKKRNDRQATIPDMMIHPSDVENLTFYREARRTITAWLEDKKTQVEFVNIGSPDQQISSYQRRLVHQLIRSEFPELRTFARDSGAFMQVVKINPKREAEEQQSRSHKFETAIGRQTGLRWIFEALTCGDLRNIDPLWFYNIHDERTNADVLKNVTRELKTITKTLKTKQQILVGHNLFTDLAFIYKTFVGTLPVNVRHFQEDIHDLFPIIYDTKYLATQTEEFAHARSGLKELLEPFKKIHQPLIILHESHTRYGSEMDHEAGYDTELFVKLSGKLYHEAKSNLDENSERSSTDVGDDDSGGIFLSSPRQHDYLSGSDSEELLTSEWATRKLHGNSFAALSLLDQDIEEDGGAEVGEVPVDQLFMPASTSPFWDAYVNKLRVMAVEGGICDLDLEWAD
ncbi:hypothetical protein HYALB_00001891 [Hymenoscyphus albidus]|uniref:CAF1-domain-containing protein n=1 Tax=Hymenoscyphus albidus TaxID=595503 RepID=A0A9N9LFS2_9HELO|nr:hypothetical protein HYALB_00001891 [Hymenoscyphus albidus]